MPPTRFERATPRLGISCSIRLSYGGTTVCDPPGSGGNSFCCRAGFVHKEEGEDPTLEMAGLVVDCCETSSDGSVVGRKRPNCHRSHENCPWSGRADLNGRPLAPQASALTRLRHVPTRAGTYHLQNELSSRFLAGHGSYLLENSNEGAVKDPFGKGR